MPSKLCGVLQWTATEPALKISVDLDKCTTGAWIYGIEMKFSALIELGTIGTHY